MTAGTDTERLSIRQSWEAEALYAEAEAADSPSRELVRHLEAGVRVQPRQQRLDVVLAMRPTVAADAPAVG